MKHKWFAFVIVMVICLSSVLVAVGAFSLFSKKTSQTTTAPIVNTPVNSGIYIQNASLLQNTATQNQTNLTITYTRWNADGDLQGKKDQLYTDRVSVNYGDTVEFKITATQGYYIQSIITGNVGETLTLPVYGVTTETGGIFAIVEEAAASTVVARGQRLIVDIYGNLIIETEVQE